MGAGAEIGVKVRASALVKAKITAATRAKIEAGIQKQQRCKREHQRKREWWDYKRERACERQQECKYQGDWEQG